MDMDIQQVWISYKENPTEDLKKLIMGNYMKLIYYVISCSSFYNDSLSVLNKKDFFQFGVEGLSEAIDRFDLKYGVKFETYAFKRIKGKIIDEIRKIEKFKPVIISLNSPIFIDEDGHIQLYEVLPSALYKQPDAILGDDIEVKQILLEEIAKLPERDRAIISLYYYENLGYKEIANILNITVSRVSQVHTRIIGNLKIKFSPIYKN